MADSLPALFISSLIQIDNRFGFNDISIRILLDMAAKAMDCDVLVIGGGRHLHDLRGEGGGSYQYSKISGHDLTANSGGSSNYMVHYNFLTINQKQS
jgi:hypothetical protein